MSTIANNIEVDHHIQELNALLSTNNILLSDAESCRVSLSESQKKIESAATHSRNEVAALTEELIVVKQKYEEDKHRNEGRIAQLMQQLGSAKTSTDEVLRYQEQIAVMTKQKTELQLTVQDTIEELQEMKRSHGKVVQQLTESIKAEQKMQQSVCDVRTMENVQEHTGALTRLSEQLRGAEEQVTHMKAALAQEKVLSARLESENESIQRRLKTLNVECKMDQDKGRTVSAHQTKKLEQMTAQAQEQQTRVDNQAAKIRGLETAHVELRETLEQKQRLMEQQKEQFSQKCQMSMDQAQSKHLLIISELEAKLEKTKRDSIMLNNDLTLRLKASEQRLQDINGQVAQCQNQLNSRQYSQLTARVNELQGLLKTQEQDKNLRLHSIAQVEMKLKAAQKNVTDAESAMAKAQSDLKGSIMTVKQLSNEKIALQKELNDLVKEKTTWQKTELTLRSQIHSATSKLIPLQNEFAQSKMKLQEFEGKTITCDKEVKALQTQVQSLSSQHSVDEDQRSDMQRKLLLLTQENERMVRELDGHKRLLEETNSTKLSLDQKMHDIAKHLAEYELQNEALATQNKDQQQKLTMAEDKLTHLGSLYAQCSASQAECNLCEQRSLTMQSAMEARTEELKNTLGTLEKILVIKDDDRKKSMEDNARVLKQQEDGFNQEVKKMETSYQQRVEKLVKQHEDAKKDNDARIKERLRALSDVAAQLNQNFKTVMQGSNELSSQNASIKRLESTITGELQQVMSMLDGETKSVKQNDKK